MRVPVFARLGLLLLGACHLTPSYAIDCRTAEGQLALMAARVVVGTPLNPSTLPLSSTRLPFSATSELFRVAADETSNTSCVQFLRARVYLSKDAAALDALNSIASSATSDTWTAPNVVVGTMTIRRSGNVLTLDGGIDRSAISVKTGATLYFRIGKQIIKEGGIDPYVFSSRFSFALPAPPAVAALPNLVARPTSTSNQNRALFKPTGASFGVGAESFLRVPDRFCANILTAGTPGASYTCGTNQQCRRLSMSITLGPVNYFSRNIGAAPAGQFQIDLQRREMVNGVSTNLVTVSSHGVKSLAVNTDSAPFSFNPNRTATVLQFPDDNPGSCFVQCDPKLAGCTPAYQELEYKVRVDGGNSATGDVTESNEGDDEGNPMGSL
jgi:hypothetical protein